METFGICYTTIFFNSVMRDCLQIQLLRNQQVLKKRVPHHFARPTTHFRKEYKGSFIYQMGFDIA